MSIATSQKKVVHFGAGAVGRGFLGQLYSAAGWETVFVDVDRTVIHALSERGWYEIHIAAQPPQAVRVEHVRGLDASDTEAVANELSTADLASTAVRPAALPAVCATIAQGLERRHRADGAPLDILICENLPDAARHFRGLLRQHISPACVAYLEHKVGLVETVISRMVPVVTAQQRAADPLFVAAEAYATLPVDRDGFVGPIPAITGLKAVRPFVGHKQRKLFTHNCGHSLCAYYGYQRGYTYVWEAVKDPEVLAEVTAALDETGRALIASYGFDPEEQRAITDDLLRRFANRALGDTVARVARDPVRKLGPHERLAGAARFALACDITPVHLARGIAHALRYDNSEDTQARELAALLHANGPGHVLQSVCKLEPSEPLYRMVMDEFSQLDAGPASNAAGRKGGAK